MKKMLEGKNGQNVMSFHGLQLIKDQQLGGKLPNGLVEDLFNEYRKLL